MDLSVQVLTRHVPSPNPREVEVYWARVDDLCREPMGGDVRGDDLDVLRVILVR